MTMPSAVSSRETVEIPVIDISPSNPNAARDILDAAANFGFVYVENNEAASMPPAGVARMFDLVGISREVNRWLVIILSTR